VACAVAGCSETDRVPEWTAWDAIDGTLQPEVQQIAIPAAPRATLRVVTYNVRRGIEVDDVAAHFASSPELSLADVILLQECTRGAGEPASDAASLAALLGMGHVYAPTGTGGDDTSGLAILSRFAMIDIAVLYLQDVVEVRTFDKVGGAMRATIETTGGPLRVVNVHLDVPLNISNRVLQLRPAVLASPPLTVVAGDFNTNDYLWAVQTLPLLPLDASADTSQAGEVDAYMRGIGYATPTAPFGSTWGGLPENQRLDAIYTRGLFAGAGGIDRTIAISDHWPLWLDVGTAPSLTAETRP
jgi:endonuclease/exonuclease/phosphatase family metal-dependent hydrolase